MPSRLTQIAHISELVEDVSDVLSEVVPSHATLFSSACGYRLFDMLAPEGQMALVPMLKAVQAYTLNKHIHKLYLTKTNIYISMLTIKMPLLLKVKQAN